MFAGRAAPKWSQQRFAPSKKTVLIGSLSVVYGGAVIYIVDPANVAAALQKTSAPTLAIAAVLVVAANVLALARSGAIVNALGFRPGWRDLFLAFSAGGVANLPLNVIGQSLTRAMVLKKAGIPFAVTVTATYIERLLAAGLLFLFSLLGLWYLFGSIRLTTHEVATVLTTLAGMTIAAGSVGVAVFRNRFATGSAAFARWIPKLWPSAMLTVLGHAAGLGAYLVLLSELSPASVSTGTAAAIIIVMLVTALPISFAGWGIRELSAASALGLVGIEPESAVAAALSIGVLYLVVTGLFAAVAFPMMSRAQADVAAPARQRSDWDTRAVQGCAIACAILLFFRLPTAFGSGTTPVNVNVADVSVFVGLGVVVLMIVAGRIRVLFPSSLLIALGGLSGLIVLGLVTSYAADNLGNWALYTRGVGWVLMLGYAALGAAMVAIAGEAGRTLIVRCLIIAAMSVCILQLMTLGFSAAVHPVPLWVMYFPLQGFANNQNAFAFELAMTGSLLVAGRGLGLFSSRPWLFGVSVAVLGVTIYFTGSRTGVVFLVTLAALDCLWSRRTGIHWHPATLLAAAALGGVILLPHAVKVMAPGLLDTEALLTLLSEPTRRIDAENTLLLHPGADAERWQTILRGIGIWLSSPILGAGLGAYVQSVVAAGEQAHGIHSIYVWLLAETGAIGLGAALVLGGLMAVTAWQRMTDRSAVWGFTAFTALAFMAIGGLVQDFFLQRLFWFVLGLAAVDPAGLHRYADARFFLAPVLATGLVIFFLAL